MWITLASLVVVLPFTANNLWQQRWVVGLSSLVVMLLLAGNVAFYQLGRKPLFNLGYLFPAVGAFLAICFQEQGVIGALWSYPAILMFYFILPRRQAAWVNVLLLAIVVPSAFSVLPTFLAARVLATLVAVSVLAGIFLHVIADQHRRLQRAATIDPLTGAHNRLQLDIVLTGAFQRAQRYGTPVTLIALDLDHFKSINDSYGHHAGDQVLRRVATLLKSRLRFTDTIFRTGGEEFLVVLDNTPEEPAASVAEELRRRIAEADILGESRPVTASLGVAQLEADESIEDWLRRSDLRLYSAKEQGRNRVVAGERKLVQAL